MVLVEGRDVLIQVSYYYPTRFPGGLTASIPGNADMLVDGKFIDFKPRKWLGWTVGIRRISKNDIRSIVKYEKMFTGAVDINLLDGRYVTILASPGSDVLKALEDHGYRVHSR